MTKQMKWFLLGLAGLMVISSLFRGVDSNDGGESGASRERADVSASSTSSKATSGEQASIEQGPALEPVESPGLDEYERNEQAALDGDYQAQRNVAYTLSTGIPNNPILALLNFEWVTGHEG